MCMHTDMHKYVDILAYMHLNTGHIYGLILKGTGE